MSLLVYHQKGVNRISIVEGVVAYSNVVDYQTITQQKMCDHCFETSNQLHLDRRFSCFGKKLKNLVFIYS